METEDRRSRPQQLIDALRPDAKAAPLSRRAVRADVVLAVVLTVIALFVAVRYPGDGPVNINPKADVGAGVPAPPPPPDPGQAPAEDEPPSVPWALVVLSTLPLAARRRYPLTQFVAVLGAALALRSSPPLVTRPGLGLGAHH